MPKGIYKRTKEHGRNISNAKKGKELSEEHKRNMRKPKSTTINMRYPKTEEHKEKLRIGSPLYNKSYEEVYGEERAKEIKKKTGEAISKAKVGKKFPKEEYPNMGWRTSRKNQILPKKDSSIEVKIQNFLKQLGIEFFTHQYMKIPHGYQCDIFIPSMNLVIECDGDYWHKYPIGREIDHIRTSELLSEGFKVLRLWEFEIKKMELNDFSKEINNY